MSMRYYVYRLIDAGDKAEIFRGRAEIPEQTGRETMNDNDARSMVADAAISKMIRSSARPLHSVIQYCELAGPVDGRLEGEGEEFSFDWEKCDLQELELKLGEED